MFAFIRSRPARLLLAVCAPLAFAACDDDDPNEDNLLSDDTLREVLRGSDYEELEDRLDEYDDLTGPLDDASASLTLFAPTDAELAAIGIDTFDTDTRGDILAYHLVAQELPLADIPEGLLTTNTFLTGTGPEGSDVRLAVRREGSAVTVNGINVTNADADVVNNGVIHTISGVLVPPSVVDFVTALEDFSSLGSAIASADASADFDLVATLDGEGPFTVFAPLNSGLMLPDSIDTADEIGDVLTYHVVQGFALSSSITDSTTLTTVNGAELVVAPNGSGGVSVTDELGNTTDVVLADVIATNGVIHAIDGVLLPDDED